MTPLSPNWPGPIRSVLPMPGHASVGQYQAMPTETPRTAASRTPRTRPTPAPWLALIGLLFLSLIPILGGALRVTELAGGADITPQNERFFDSPLPVVVHIVSATVFSLLGALQFLPSLRSRRSWHRVAGRVLIPAGVLVALSGLWMTLFYVSPPHDGVAVFILRLVFGSAMLASITSAILAIRRRDFVQHGAWMTRAYAIAVAAGTQALLLIIPGALSVPADATIRGVLLGAGWLVNLAVAEFVIYRRTLRFGRPAVLSADPKQRAHPYAEDVTRLLRSMWNAPGAVPSPPRRVWRDWVLVSVVVLLAVFEGLIRSEEPWALLSMLTLVIVAPTLLWRRTHPLLMLAISFTALAGIAVVTGDSAQLYSSAFLILLPYALFRWGSGRDILIGSTVMLADVGVSAILGTRVVDLLGEFAVIVPVLILGLALRYRATARLRQLDQAKLLEREQLARDLHDTVAHHVSAIVIRAQAGLATAGQNPDAATDALGVIEAEAAKTLAEMRSMVRVLRRDEAPDLSPSPQVADVALLAGVENGGPRVDVSITGDTGSIPPTVAAALYRLAQESVTNARRHARHVSHIDVRVEADAAGVRLSVRDDGQTGPPATPGYGITGMKERAALLGGTCEAGRAPGNGWVVTAVLPRAGWLA